MDIRREIAALLGQAVVDIAPLGGGCVSAVYEVGLGDGRRLVVKADDSGASTLPVEAHMLSYLAERGLPAPAAVAVSDRLLVMAYVEGDSLFDAAAERHAAELLAALHGQSAPAFGFVASPTDPLHLFILTKDLRRAARQEAFPSVA